jgi:hypothetical protein
MENRTMNIDRSSVAVVYPHCTKEGPQMRMRMRLRLRILIACLSPHQYSVLVYIILVVGQTALSSYSAASASLYSSYCY